ncbi:S24 family peptidase [Altererythrobacter ishigakiensis]|uniref:S24 family peptidase n=1 Tax=Altererythrobacter ishigakiensis TaxID=476157 RepID=UPI001FE0EADC|nr:S24 family peptidase [Altererythrobacter ishigakiensis]
MGDLAHRRIRDQLTGYGDTIMVKRVASQGAGPLALLSQNLAYPPVEVSADEAEIIGRVVWKSGRL